MAALATSAAGHSVSAHKVKVKLRYDRDSPEHQEVCLGNSEESARLEQEHRSSPAASSELRCRECGLCQDVVSFSLKQVKAFTKLKAKLATQENGSGQGIVNPLCSDCAMQLRQEENREPVCIPMCHVCGVAQDRMLGRRAADGGSVASSRRGSCLYATDPAALPQGVRYYPNFLSEEEERKLLDILDSKTWAKLFRRRQQFYGEVYYHTTREVASVQPVLQGDSYVSSSHQTGAGRHAPTEEALHEARDSSVTPHDLAALQFLADKFYQWPFVQPTGGRVATDVHRGDTHACSHASAEATDGLCDCTATSCDFCNLSASCPIFGKSPQEFPSQILVNEYVDNWGIASHFEDFAAFGDTIATISLGNPVYMTLEQPKEKNNQCGEILKDTKILLERRSLLVISGEARNAYRHGISQHRNVWTPDQGLLKRENGYRRVSLTIRHLLSGRRQAGQ